MNEKLKNGIITVLVAILGLLGYNQFGAGFTSSIETIMGSSSNAISMPNSMVEANATTTDSGTIEDAGTIDQHLSVGGIDEIIVNVLSVGGTATSTAYMRIVGSFNGTNYFNLSSSTTTNVNATNTLIALPVQAISFDPGTATTTGESYRFNVKGYTDVRVMVWQENASTDPNDGVQAWITATKIEGISS